MTNCLAVPSKREFLRPRFLHSSAPKMGSLESSPRICRSQADHPVTGSLGAVHPIGHPISQSEKFGLKVRSPAEYLAPAVKLKWSGCEERKLKAFGLSAQLVTISQIIVHSFAALPIATWLPVWPGSSRSFIPSADSSISMRLQ